jgi:hypothetical protein
MIGAAITLVPMRDPTGRGRLRTRGGGPLRQAPAGGG